MPLQARRVFRLSLTVAISLALAYGLQVPMPFITPLFALIIMANPGPPIGLKGLVGLVIVVLITLGIGLLLIPLLLHYPMTAVLLVALGLFFSAYLTIHLGKGLVGMLLTMGFTLISVAGLVNFALATTVIESLVTAITLAILCQWLIYPWFPEDDQPARPAAAPDSDPAASRWIALRASLIVLPVYLLALSNPSMYMATIMKTVSLGQQSSLVDAKNAGRELLGSTFLAGLLAILFWALLGILTNLWMFFLLTLLCCLYLASKLYQLWPSRYPASYWVNVGVTLLILLGPAVQDSDSGNDVYSAFVVRMALFIGVALYAWLAVSLLEQLRTHMQRRAIGKQPSGGTSPC
jgi:hypothetical protein